MTIIIQNIFCYQLTKKVLNNVTKYLTAQFQDFKNKIYEPFAL